MASHATAVIDGIKPKMLAAGLRRGESAAKPLGEADRKRQIGLLIERALALADMTKQEASYEMGYTDQSSISKWIAGKEPPQFDKLMAIAKLRPWLSVAFAEIAGAGVEVEHVVRVRRVG